jgi:DNA-directed RNA polymerase subunit beta'
MLNPIKTTDFEAIKLKLASPEEIVAWSHGEVTRPETINYRTQKPEKDGLFCEKIFGPSKDWECYCGKYKKVRYKGIVCDKCGVEVTRSSVRRERMGHITLQTPVCHIWFLRGLSSKIGLALNISVQAIEKVIYFASFVITEVNQELLEATSEQIRQEYKSKKKLFENEFANGLVELDKQKQAAKLAGQTELEIKQLIDKVLEELTADRDAKIGELEEVFAQTQKELKELRVMTILSENAYQNLSLKYGHIFTASIGAEGIRELLVNIDLEQTIKELEATLVGAIDSKKEKIIKRLRFFKNLLANNLRPEWMILKVVPIIPPDLRPMVALDGGRFATSDLNDLYRRIINRNNRLKQLMDLKAPEVICRNEKRMLQEAVDALIDNSIRHGKTVTASTGQKRTLKSLSDSLKGKQGRFRQNLLGKRTDYSGRSVITVNPNLRLWQCGLPKRMALELFKPFIISQLIKREVVHNVRSASRYIEAGHDDVWEILENIINDAYVLLNRAPTLHRLGIQAFKPLLTDGLSIQIHPLVCSAFNADFDGDQMAVHVPLTDEARIEARDIMLASHNLLKPATGDPIVSPGQDIVWGVYYITSEEKDANCDLTKMKTFSSWQEAKLAYECGQIRLREPIRVQIDYLQDELLTTTVGRVIFNNILPEKLRFVNEIVLGTKVKALVKDCLRHYGETVTVDFLDDLKLESFKFITNSGLSWGMGDLPDFKDCAVLITQSEVEAEEVQQQYEDGLLTDSERYGKIIQLWTATKDKITTICMEGLDHDGPLYSMIKSGARGSWAQLTQILGMKGLVTSPSGEIIELPIKGNFKRGFDVLEYFIATHGVRKGLSDTALRTANAGYLTRRLVDVSQDIIIREDDCGSQTGLLMTKEESELIGRTLLGRITGRYLSADLKNSAGTVLAHKGELIDEEVAIRIAKEDLLQAEIYSVLTCLTKKGLCKKCYGHDLAYNKIVKTGTAVGVMAAQSIGEPGTQLTMRTFHTGGVASQEDITQGLPRVEEVFEARSPKRRAYVAEVSGLVTVENAQKTVDPATGKVVGGGNNKVAKIVYQGEDVDKYYFFGESKAAKNKLDDGQTDIKIAVKEGAMVGADTKLFSSGRKVTKANRPGKVSLGKNFVSVLVETPKEKEYIIPKNFALIVKNGQAVEPGDQLTDGSLDLRQLFELKGQVAAQKYIIQEIQRVYSSQGQALNDKHIEIIARQMFSRVYIVDSADSDLTNGEVIERSIFDQINEDLKTAKKQPAKGNVLLLGMTKTALTTESFLSSASFQETSRVLIEEKIRTRYFRYE